MDLTEFTGDDKLSKIEEMHLLGQMLKFMRPPPVLSSVKWAETYRILGPEVSALAGRYRGNANPIMLRVMEAVDDPAIKVIVGIKSAQIGWTEAINNCLGKRIHVDPANIIIAFPSQGAGVSYAHEKFRPFVRSTPVLLERLGDPDKSAWNRYSFVGGFLKFVTAGSISQIKSTPASFIIVEEPDDLIANIKQQGDSLGVLKERLKTYNESKLIYGGTPSYKGVSRVAEAFKHSCQYEYQVPCHECKQFHMLSFSNLICKMYINNIIDDKYGEYNPETAAYHCPKCNTVWGDRQKNINLQQALQWHDLGWKKKYPEREDIGFCFTELMSIFASSTFVNLAKKQLAAEWAFHHGKEEELIVFVNNSKGEAYENKATSLVESDLQKKALSYAEQKVVKDGLMLTMGIDVQHNRFAYAVRAWGDNGVSWLVHYTEVFGNVLNTKDKVWGHLASVCKKPYYWLGKTDVQLRPSAISIDASDGMTTEAVYGFVKVLNSEGVNIMAVKGSSETYTEQEIFTVPKNRLTTVVGKVKSLAETMGVVIYPVGTNRAKDFILRQLQNESVNDRMHYYSTVLPTYYKQLLSNSKRIVGTRVRYFKKYGHQDEALDCEVYALHAARSLFIHLRTSEEWTRHKEILLADLSDTIMEIAPAKITGKASRIKDTFD